MNRNQVYTYLKEMDDMKGLMYKHGKGYHIRFVPTIWTTYSELFINKFMITNWYSITLLVQGIVVEDEKGDMEIHIKYQDIDSFIAYIEEGYNM